MVVDHKLLLFTRSERSASQTEAAKDLPRGVERGVVVECVDSRRTKAS